MKISKLFIPHGKLQRELESITYEDILTMSKKELEKTITKYSNYLNKRYEKLERAVRDNKAISKDAYEYMQKSRGGRLFSTIKEDKTGTLQDMTIDELRSELNQEVYFANLKTSSVTGARSEQMRREDIVRQSHKDDEKFLELMKKDVKKAEEQIRDEAREFWKYFKKLKESYSNLDSNQILREYKKYYDPNKAFKKNLREKLDDIRKGTKETKSIKEASYEATEQTGYQNPFGDNTLYNEIDKNLSDKERFPFG